mmetsp:Transcript_13627/g.31680  ORF Transcript_13627/g.31680 Transcript_13627/m.31680 type:complete len:138 (-) Transcript_13627:709-1122(-)
MAVVVVSLFEFCETLYGVMKLNARTPYCGETRIETPASTRTVGNIIVAGSSWNFTHTTKMPLTSVWDKRTNATCEERETTHPHHNMMYILVRSYKIFRLITPFHGQQHGIWISINPHTFLGKLTDACDLTGKPLGPR